LLIKVFIKKIADLPTMPEFITAISASDTAILPMDSAAAIASQKMQTNLTTIQN
jgi:hypothetical protein